MSGDESAAEGIVEAGFEIISPGGRPDELRQAAKAWRKMKSDLAGSGGILQALDRDVANTVGNSWRGPAAEAFEKHWNEFRQAVEQATEQYDEIASGLDEAANAIEECNDEIHAIYAEIGISIGVGVALSFVSFGFGGAAAAANATRLAAQAVRLAGRLGDVLRRIGAAFRTLRTLAQTHKFLSNVGINAIGNFAGSLGSAALEGGITSAELRDAAWQSSLGALAGTGPGLAVAGKVAGHIGEGLGVLWHLVLLVAPQATLWVDLSSTESAWGLEISRSQVMVSRKWAMTPLPTPSEVRLAALPQAVLVTMHLIKVITSKDRRDFLNIPNAPVQTWRLRESLPGWGPQELVRRPTASSRP